MRLFSVLGVLIGIFGFTLASYAGVEVGGKVFYKHEGSIVKRGVSLEIPPKGQGDVILRGENFEMTADNFFAREINGRTVFYIVFSKPEQILGMELTNGHQKKLVFRGTYTRGDNIALYYGDAFFIKHGHGQSFTPERKHGFLHAAGFVFKAPIESEEFYQ